MNHNKEAIRLKKLRERQFKRIRGTRCQVCHSINWGYAKNTGEFYCLDCNHLWKDEMLKWAMQPVLNADKHVNKLIKDQQEEEK